MCKISPSDSKNDEDFRRFWISLYLLIAAGSIRSSCDSALFFNTFYASTRTSYVLLTVRPILLSFDVTLKVHTTRSFTEFVSQKNVNGLRIHVFTKCVLRAILLNIQDPAAPSETCSACYSLKFQDPAARNIISRNIGTTTRYVRIFFRRRVQKVLRA